MALNFKTYLSDWGLSDFEENFELEGITDESFFLIDEETLKSLIPKLGPRLIFKEKFTLLKSERQISKELIVYDSSEVSQGSTDTYDSSLYSFIPDDDFSNQYLRTSTPEKVITEDKIESTNKTNNQTEVVDLGSSIPSKILKLESVFPQGLEAALRKYPDGQVILLNKNKINNNLRNKLTKILITELFGQFGINQIKGVILGKVAREIENTFPEEKSETYFVPYNPANKRGPQGKLYSKFINIKSSLKLANSSIHEPKEPEVDTKERDINGITDDEEQNYLEFLKVGLEPITRVFDAWQGSFKLRRRLYLNRQLSEIYEDFPCLKINKGIELIESDFNNRYSDLYIDVIYKTWPKVRTAILSEIRERKINDLNATEDDVGKILFLLPLLFSPVTIKKSRKQGSIWRPSRAEIQESFFMHIEDCAELDERIKIRKEKLLKHGVTLQPFGVIVGDFNSPHYMIVVDDVRYQVETGIRALELLFKLFHAMDIAYPQECAPVWKFLENIVFEMKGNMCPVATSVYADISFHLKSLEKNSK